MTFFEEKLILPMDQGRNCIRNYFFIFVIPQKKKLTHVIVTEQSEGVLFECIWYSIKVATRPSRLQVKGAPNF